MRYRFLLLALALLLSSQVFAQAPSVGPVDTRNFGSTPFTASGGGATNTLSDWFWGISKSGANTIMNGGVSSSASILYGTTGSIAAFGTVTGGSGYTNGTYTAVPLTGGSGTGATATVVVAGGAVTTVTRTNPGSGGYTTSDTLSALASSIGGTGSGFSVPVALAGARSGPGVSPISFSNGVSQGVSADTPGLPPTYYSWTITNDDLDASAPLNVESFLISEACCGSQAKGYRQLFTPLLNINHAPADTGGNYVAIVPTAQINVTLGGSGGTGGVGGIFGENIVATAVNGATNLNGIIGSEIDVGRATGASSMVMQALSLVQTSNSTVPATVVDIAEVIANKIATTTNGWDYLITDGSYNGFHSLKSGGTWIACYPHANSGNCGTIGSFADLSKYTTITNNIINGPGGTHFIDGSFNLNVGNITAGSISASSISGPIGGGNPGYIASNWYAPTSAGATLSSGAATTANRIACSYGGVPATATIGALGAKVTGNTASTNFQLAIYTASSGKPATLLSSTGNMSGASIATVTASLGAAKQVGPGGADGSNNLFFCFNADNSTITLLSLGIAGQTAQASMIGSTAVASLLTSTNTVNGVSCSGAACTGGSSTFNTWPASLAGSTWTDITTAVMPYIVFQLSSVP